MAVALMSVISVHQDAFAAESGMSITATAEEGGNIISITGTTSSNQGDVVFTVTTPDQHIDFKNKIIGTNIQAIGQEAPDANGEFSLEFNVSNWKQDGMYKIKAQQGSSTYYTMVVSVEVTSGTTAETSTTESGIVTTQRSGDPILYHSINPSIEVKAGLYIAANAIEGSDTIEITGHSTRTYDVTFIVTAPNGNIVSIDQITPKSNGDFATNITVGGPLWSQDGMYTVTAQQGSGWNSGNIPFGSSSLGSQLNLFTDSVKVEIVDGHVIPEFGTIAAMILAVAIISIIAISAKSRLSIVPRY